MEKRKVTWVPFTRTTARTNKVLEGEYAFIGSEIIGAVYTFHENDEWYGTFAGERIGSCRDREMAVGNVEHRWQHRILTPGIRTRRRR